MSEANYRSTPQCLGYVLVGVWECIMLKIESIPLEKYSFVPINGFVIGKYAPISIKS